MQLDALGGLAGASYSGTAAKPQADDGIGKDAFLRLLTTQLQNQDPLNPMDNTEFVAQLAQFSSVEGITNLNSSMKGVSSGIAEMSGYSTATLVGRTVKAEGDVFGFNGSPVSLGIGLVKRAETVNVSVYDSNGRMVRRMGLGAKGEGYHAVQWDGKDSMGQAVAPGRYAFAVEAKDAKGAQVGYYPYVTGTVTGVSLDAGAASLLVGGVEVSKERIREIY